MSKKDGGKGGGEKEKDVTALYKDLQTHKQSEDYEKAIKVCNRILNIDPADSLAFHCKLVAMIHAGKFEEALKQIEGSKMADLDVSFETAYCYYRLNNLDQSLRVLDCVKKEEMKHCELRAQIMYKLEQYEECYNVYRTIIKNTSDDYETERKTNLSAVAAQMADSNNIGSADTETFELRYNSGCGLAAVGEYEEAESVLRGAESAARHFLEEEGEGEEEIEEEIGIIKVQLGYVLQRLGKEKEAQAIYNSVLKAKPSDIGLVAVASNNLITINRDQNIFDSKKRIKAATAEGLEHKLTSSQRGQIARNQALLAMFTAQVDLCKQLVEQLDSSVVPDKDIILAGALAKSGKYQAAVDQLVAVKDPVRVLTAGQVLLSAGEAKKASELLTGLLPQDWKSRPGVLSTIVSLYLVLDDRPAAAAALKAATEWNLKRDKAASCSGDMAVVWRKTAEFHLNSGEAQVAAQSLEEMLRVSPDLRTLAQLVLAYAKFDLNKAMEVSKKLPPFDSSLHSVDLEALEESSFSTMMGKNMKRNNPITPKTPKKDEGEGVVKKRLRRKKKRLPKNYNPQVTPDPERWIPRRERTGLKYSLPGQRKIRKDKRKPEKFTGAQGTNPGQSETFDYSTKMAASKEAAAKASPQPNEGKTPTAGPGPRLQKKIQSKSKKKGGGKNKF